MSLISRARFFLQVRFAILIAGGLLSLNAAATSSKLHHYSLSECTKDFCLSANGADAYLSLMSPTVAAENVSLKLTYSNGLQKTYVCSSMAYLLESSILTCEDKLSNKTLVVDFATSQISHF